MKKCEQFKDLILTDYIDGQLDKNFSESLEGHLLDCSDCRAFFKEVKNNATLPFQKVLQQPVPAGLWSAIKQNIEQENQAAAPLSDFIKKLKGLIVFPRLVPVFASVVLMFLAGSVTLNTVQVQRAQDRDQGEYLVALLSSTGSSAQGDNNDLGTPIEHYFL
jgi:anti-sigma factor RsiW